MRSFINKLKRSGLSMEPSGTPAITTSDELVLLFMTTCFSCISSNYVISLKQLLKNHRLLVLLKEGCRLWDQKPWRGPYTSQKYILLYQ